jgi:type IV pilus assembly protein PilM
MVGKLFHNDKPIAGLDISTTGIKIMAVDPKKMVVLGYGSFDFDPAHVQQGMSNDVDFLADALKKLLSSNLKGHLPSNQVVMSVPTSRTFSRMMVLPAESQKNLADAVQLEAEQYIPVAVSELYVDYQILEQTPKDLNVLVSAVPKKIVDNLTVICDKAGLVVTMIEPGINASARLIKVTEEGHLPSIIVDIGAATSDIGLLDNGTVRLTGSVAVGGHTFTLRIAEALKVSLEEAHQLKVQSGLGAGPNQSKLKLALEGSLGQIVSEMRKIIRYYNERIGVKTKIEQIIIVGGGSNVPGIGEIITDAMLMPARVASPWDALKFGRLEPPNRNFKPRYITAAGLAIIDPKEIWR